MAQVSDVELIRNCQQGDEASFRILVDRYKDRIYTAVYRILGNVQDAEDIAQEVFVAAYRAISSFDVSRKLLPWILKIATNLSIDHLRRKHPQIISLDSPEAAEVQWNEYPLEDVEASELLQLTEQLVTQLPDKYRAAVSLYYTQDLTYNEVADILDIPVGTVKTYLHRAREILKARLQTVLSDSVKA